MGPSHRHGSKGKGVISRLRALLTERNFLIGLAIMFIVQTIWIVTVPYDPIDGDKADATTNVVWAEYYREGKIVVPYDEWKEENHPPTQSSVIEIDGEPYVINEKGPAHALFCIVLGPATGTVFAFVAVISTYMLGRRIFCWQVGAIASLIILTNLTVIIMWLRYWWVDTSTMHLLALAMWLFVESGLRLKRYIIGKAEERTNKDLMLASMLGLAGGVSFGASIATRYPMGLVIIPIVIYIVALFGRTLMDGLKARDLRKVARTFGHAFMMALPFVLGLVIVLIPLINYNNTYFGGPFNSGYDPMTIMDYDRSGGDIAPRNQTGYASTNLAQKAENIVTNSIALYQIILIRMIALLFVPYAVWKLRKRPILWLLLPLIIVIFLAFLSLSWVSMYAGMLDIVQEPRYFLPTLPAVALLAGYSIDSISKIRPNPGTRRAAFTIAVVILISLNGVLQAERHFKDVRDGKLSVDKPRGPQGPPPVEATKVTVSDIYARYERLDKNFVDLKGAVVERIIVDDRGRVLVFEVSDASDVRNVTVMPEDFPDGAFNDIVVGTTINVIGPFEWRDIDKNGIADGKELIIRVKNGTKDQIIIIK